MTGAAHDRPPDGPDGEVPADGAAELLPLRGYTVAVTAARRTEELGALLDRRGARVVHAPAIRIVPLSDDAELVAATRQVLASPVDLVVATTGVGFRGWLEAAEAWDLPLRRAPAERPGAGPRPEGARGHPRRRAGGRVVAGVGVLRGGPRTPAVRRRGSPARAPDRRPAARGPAARAGVRAARRPAQKWCACRSTAGCSPRTPHRCAGWSPPSPPAGSTRSPSPALPRRPACCRSPARSGRAGRGARRLRRRASWRSRSARSPPGRWRPRACRTVQPERARLGALARSVVAELPARRPGADRRAAHPAGARARRRPGRAAGRAAAGADGGAAGAGPPSRPRRPPRRPARRSSPAAGTRTRWRWR